MAKKLQLHGSFPSKAGEPGGYYTPNVSNPDAETLEFTFTESKEGMPAVPPVSVPIPSGAPEVHIGTDEPKNGEKLWYNPDEEPEGDDASLEEVVSQVVDNCVPDWAKRPEKPKYTAAEVGALPADTVIPSGGGGREMELLATVTVEEAVTSVIISSCDDGTPFSEKKLTRIGAYAMIIGNPDITTAGNLAVIAGETHPMGGYMAIRNVVKSETKYAWVEYRTLGRCIFGVGCFDSNNWYHQLTRFDGKSFPTIDVIRFFVEDNSGHILPVGSTFEIWGC